MKRMKFLCMAIALVIGLFCFSACGDDGTNDGDGKKGSYEVELNDAFFVGTWETYAVVVNGKEIKVNSTDENVWQYWHCFEFTNLNKFKGYSINYNGDAEVRGREELTMIGGYSVDGPYKAIRLFDLVEGYKNIKAYYAGEYDKTTNAQVEILSASEYEVSIMYPNQGNIVMKLKRTSFGVDPNHYSDNGNEGVDPDPQVPEVQSEDNKLLVGTWVTDRVIANGQEIAISPTDESVWRYWNRFVFGEDDSFNGFAINYQGDEEVRGREEHTMIGKFSFDKSTMQITLTDFVEGYHNVIAYLEGNNVTKSTHVAIIQYVDDKVLVIENSNQGENVTIVMKKI